jgi:hypothetical protein
VTEKCDFKNCRSNTGQVNHDFCYQCRWEQERRQRRAVSFMEEAERELDALVEDEYARYKR